MVRVTSHGEEQRRTLLITLDRPHRRNAVDLETLRQLQDAQAAAVNSGARCVVLTGEPPAFCAGADLDGVHDDEFAAALYAVLTGFTALPVVVIAAIEGAALGAGTQLAAACDLRVATAASAFGIPAARLGLAVDAWTVRRLGEQFTPSVARAMLLAAAQFDGSRLHDVGAVHRLGTLADALAWADEIATLAPLTIAAHKLALERAATAAPLDGDVERARLAAWSSDDAVEGRTAFREKRAPRFSGR